MAQNAVPPVPKSLNPRPRENWGTKIGVIFAVAGSAVGLGNFLRFPGQVATNGGGVYMIPYFISLLLLGIPICWIEWGMGRYGGARGFNSAPGIFSVIWRNPISKYFGALAVLIPVVIYMYYVYIEAWCLTYAWEYLRGGMMEVGRNAATPAAEVEAYGNFFGKFVGIERNGFPASEGLIILAIVYVINFFLIYRGIAKGIETFSKIAMPLLLICAVIVLVRVLTLGTPDPAFPERSLNNGLGYMWNPRIEGSSIWSALANPQLWLNASGQIFFSLSVGFGIVLNYASYLRRNDDVVLSGLTASSMNEFCEVCLAGLITVPVAYMFLGPETLGTQLSTFSVGFNALPAVFLRMPLGQIFGFLWFFMLFVAAITSSLSMLQPAIAFLEEGLNLRRHVSVALLGLIVMIGSLIVVFFSEGLLALDTMDTWVGTFCIFVLATIQVVMFAWVFGIERAKQEIMHGAEIKIPAIFWFIMKYISPVYLLVIFGTWCWFTLPGVIRNVRGMESESRGIFLFVIAFLLFLLGFFAFLIHLARDRFDNPETTLTPPAKEM